jgi:hypothetical protein
MKTTSNYANRRCQKAAGACPEPKGQAKDGVVGVRVFCGVRL